MLIRAIGDRASLAERLVALDAGCGKGFFSRSLASCGIRVDGIRLGGRLIVADECRPDRRPAGNYIVHRAHDAYQAILGEVGLTLRGFWPYAYRENEVGLFIFDRTG